jgi:dipeptidase E
VKLLLTSAGISNPSIEAALLTMLGKPIRDAVALCIPTASYGHPMAGPVNARNFVAGTEPACPMTGLGWKSVGLLELTALPSLGSDRWVEWVRAADVQLVDGGDARYLAHWMAESGLVALLPTLDVVWVGLSAGSMVMAPRIGHEFVEWHPEQGDDRTLGLVDFSIFPHLGHPDLKWNTIENARRWAAKLDGPCYAIDDQTAIAVVDGRADVISEGTWQLVRAGRSG